jgi:putative Ca2+/H+ antiporter (TMEM165/GDT1 family)
MIVDWLLAAGKAFAAIAPVELPDKTFVATLVLATRYRPLLVWLGVVTAFAVHSAIAVVAGSLVSLLPATPVRLVAAGLFAVGAVIMLREARRTEHTETQEYEQRVRPVRASAKSVASAPAPRDRSGPGQGGVAAYGASFLLLFTAEWGDLSQLFTMGLVASGEPPVAVFLGAWAALATVSGAAVLVGRWVQRKVRLSIVRYLAAAVCATLAVITAVSAAG